jgi:hypothetical protein
MVRILARVIAVLGISFGQAAAMNAETVKKFHHAVHIGDINTVRSMISANPALTQTQMPKATTAKARSPSLGKEVTLDLWRY